MISVSAMESGQHVYYTTLAREDYFTRGDEAEGFYLGKGAAKLGLSGRVEKEALSQLFRGFHPAGHPLVRNAGRMTGKRSRRPGFDLCCSCPKSLSVLFALAPPEEREQIQEAIHAAVSKTITYLEENLAFSRTGRGGTGRIKSDLVVAAFPHGTSRALDPQYHVHALILNIGVSEDGNTRTIISKLLAYKSKILAGSLFRAYLAQELRNRLPLEFVRPLDGNGQPKAAWEVKGVPEWLCRVFSKRRVAMEKEAGPGGLETASAAAQVALVTRQRKRVIPPRRELFTRWREEARKLGFRPERVHGLLKRERPEQSIGELGPLVKEAANRLTSQQSFFSEKELLIECLNASQGRNIDPDAICQSLREEVTRSPHLVTLGDRDGQTWFTTQGIMATEKRLLDAVESLKGAHFKPLSERLIKRLVEKQWAPQPRTKNAPVDRLVERAKAARSGFTLSEEQAAALRYVTQSPGRFKAISGLAGTGKTTVLRAVKQACEKAGYRVRACALAGATAKRLQADTGIKSDTVAMFLKQQDGSRLRDVKHHARQLARAARKKKTYRLDRGKITSKDIIFVDETGLLGTPELARVAEKVARAGATLVCVGDEKQLPSVGPGGGFASIIERFGCVRMENITRQREPAERETVKKLARGEATEVMREYARNGQLHVAEDRKAAQERLLADWTAAGGTRDPAKHVTFVRTRREVDWYNRRMQQERARKGELVLSKYVSLPQGDLCVNDRVIFEKKSRALGIENGSMGTVCGVKKTVVGVDLSVRLDGEDHVRIIPVHRLIGRDYKHIRLGYAFTTHKLQGATVDHAYLPIGGRMTSREMTYVQGSRHRHTLRLYTTQQDAGIELTNLAREATGEPLKVLPGKGEDPKYSPLIEQVGRSEAKRLAHDFRPEQKREAESEKEGQQQVQQEREQKDERGEDQGRHLKSDHPREQEAGAKREEDGEEKRDREREKQRQRRREQQHRQQEREHERQREQTL